MENLKLKNKVLEVENIAALAYQTKNLARTVLRLQNFHCTVFLKILQFANNGQILFDDIALTSTHQPIQPALSYARAILQVYHINAGRL